MELTNITITIHTNSDIYPITFTLAQIFIMGISVSVRCFLAHGGHPFLCWAFAGR